MKHKLKILDDNNETLIKPKYSNNEDNVEKPNQDISNAYKIEIIQSNEVQDKVNEEGNIQAGIMYNPTVNIDQSLLKKHNSLAPLDKKKDSFIEYKPINSIEDKDKQNSVNIGLRLKKKLSNSRIINAEIEQATKKLEESSKIILIKRPQWKINIEAFIESNAVIIFMTIVTIFVLFINDIQYAASPTTYDNAIDIGQCISFGLFIVEIILSCICKENYLFSFFFWLDVIATLSLIQDISFIFNPMINGSTPTTTTGSSTQKAQSTISKVSTASR